MTLYFISSPKFVQILDLQNLISQRFSFSEISPRFSQLIATLFMDIINQVKMSANLRANIVFKIGCLSMFSFVAMGARFGHKGQLEEDGQALFQKGQLYHITNNIGFFAASFITRSSLPLKIAVGGFAAGTLIFVFPLYYMAVMGKNPYITKTMPAGGAAMLISWLSLMLA